MGVNTADCGTESKAWEGCGASGLLSFASGGHIPLGELSSCPWPCWPVILKQSCLTFLCRYLFANSLVNSFQKLKTLWVKKFRGVEDRKKKKRKKDAPFGAPTYEVAIISILMPDTPSW